MRRFLIGTTALAGVLGGSTALVGVMGGSTALVGVMGGSTARATEWEVTVGGTFETFAAYAASDIATVSGEKLDGVDSKQDAEIGFNAALTLDNGLRFGATVVLEGASTADTIDSAFATVEGSFGTVVLGSEASAGYQMFYAAPDVTFLNVNSGSTTAFVPYSGTASGVTVGADVFVGTLGTTFLENGAGANDGAQRFTYYTPRFAGFQLGVSYARDGGTDDNLQRDLDGEDISDIVDIGLNYVREYDNGIDIALAGRWGIAQADPTFGDTPTVWGAGVQIGYAGLRLGGSFAEQNDTLLQDGRAFDAGISYETGPWGVSFTYMDGRNVNDEAVGSDETLKQYLLGVSYALAAGVTFNGFGAYVDFQEEIGDLGAQGDDVDGFIIGTGLQLAF